MKQARFAPRLLPMLLLALGALPVAQTANASSLVLTDANNYLYNGHYVGPYSGTLTDSGVTTSNLFFCLNENKTVSEGTSYKGTTHTPATEEEQEAALLASYMVYVQSTVTDTTALTNIAGAISMAIWQIMGTLTSSVDPAAQVYVQWAESLYASGSIPDSIIQNATVFVPCNSSIQSFITAIDANDYFESSAVPEPGTVVMLGAGLALLCAGAIRRRSARKPV